MEKQFLLLPLLLLPLTFLNGLCVPTTGTNDASEQWGYIEVRPKAHLFWWLYKSPYRVEDPSKPWPILLWLQGGPGGSSVGFGNFGEIGPLDEILRPRNSTWLQKADLLFVDSPVGTGFSYVEDESLVVKTDHEAAADLTTLLIQLFSGNETLQKSPLYIFAESYGGKFAVTLAVAALQAIEAGNLKVQLDGVALGDSWISPEDFVFSWGPLLKDISRIDENCLNQSNSLALKIQQQLAEGKSEDATATWNELEDVISANSNFVDFYNFMLDEPSKSVLVKESSVQSNGHRRYRSYRETRSTGSGMANDVLGNLMNGAIKQKLKIIPPNVSWQGQGHLVFPAMAGEFMKPRIEEVDRLLAKGVNVAIYNGQLDLICATKGVEAWVNKLKWDGLSDFLTGTRTPLYCGEDHSSTAAFVRSHKNLVFYWILGAGHMVPVDQPCISLQMVGTITRSPNAS